MLLILPILAFLLGSIPFGLLIARIHGVDIRTQGSGNIGATNVLRTIGKKAGYTCLFLDFLKGFIPVLIASNILRWDGASDPQMHISALDGLRVFPTQFNAQLIQVLCGLCAVLGHNYSPWIGFKGGKGIATSGGVLCALAPAAVALLILFWVVVFLLTRYVSIASIATSAALPLVIIGGSAFHGKLADGTYNKPLFYFSIILGALAIWKHRSNIRKLLNGTENRFTKKPKAQ